MGSSCLTWGRVRVVDLEAHAALALDDVDLDAVGAARAHAVDAQRDALRFDLDVLRAGGAHEEVVLEARVDLQVQRATVPGVLRDGLAQRLGCRVADLDLRLGDFGERLDA